MNRLDRIASRVAGRVVAGMKFEPDDKGFVEVSCQVKGDGLWSVLKLLRNFQYHGGIGHSFGVVSDPDMSEYRMEVGWDGDGADQLKDIKVNGDPLDVKQFDKDEMKWGKE